MNQFFTHNSPLQVEDEFEETRQDHVTVIVGDGEGGRSDEKVQKGRPGERNFASILDCVRDATSVFEFNDPGISHGPSSIALQNKVTMASS